MVQGTPRDSSLHMERYVAAVAISTTSMQYVGQYRGSGKGHRLLRGGGMVYEVQQDHNTFPKSKNIKKEAFTWKY